MSSVVTACHVLRFVTTALVLSCMTAAPYRSDGLRYTVVSLCRRSVNSSVVVNSAEFDTSAIPNNERKLEHSRMESACAQTAAGARHWWPMLCSIPVTYLSVLPSLVARAWMRCDPTPAVNTQAIRSVRRRNQQTLDHPASFAVVGQSARPQRCAPVELAPMTRTWIAVCAPDVIKPSKSMSHAEYQSVTPCCASFPCTALAADRPK